MVGMIFDLFKLDLIRSRTRLWQLLERPGSLIWINIFFIKIIRVICLLEAEIAPPRKSSRPGAGSISFTMDFLPMAHPSAIDSNAADSEVERCLMMLETLYRDTYCIDFETLCVEVNKFVFYITALC